MKENKFQGDLIKEIKEMFPDSMVLKNDAGYIQGIPDLSIFYRDKYAFLECKKSRNEKHQPNQDWYVEKIDGMSFARFVYPENKEEVLHELQELFEPERPTCVSEPE